MRKGNLFAIIFFGLIALSTMSSFFTSFLKPDVLALFIPIIAIVCFSPIGRAIALAISGKYAYNQGQHNEIEDLKIKYSRLEAKIQEYEEETLKLRESVVFYQEKKNIDNNINHINLQKKNSITLNKSL